MKLTSTLKTVTVAAAGNGCFVPLDDDVYVSFRLYEALMEIVAEDARRADHEKAALTRSEIEERIGKPWRRIVEPLSHARRHYEKTKRLNDAVRNESDKAFRQPSASLYPSQRKANGQIYHPLRHEVLEGDSAPAKP